MAIFEFDQSQADQMAMNNWAAEIAKNESVSKSEQHRESYCIDSTRLREMQKGIFYTNHKFHRKP